MSTPCTCRQVLCADYVGRRNLPSTAYSASSRTAKSRLSARQSSSSSKSGSASRSRCSRTTTRRRMSLPAGSCDLPLLYHPRSTLICTDIIVFSILTRSLFSSCSSSLSDSVHGLYVFQCLIGRPSTLKQNTAVYPTTLPHEWSTGPSSPIRASLSISSMLVSCVCEGRIRS